MNGVTVFHSAANSREHRFLEIVDHPADWAHSDPPQHVWTSDGWDETEVPDKS